MGNCCGSESGSGNFGGEGRTLGPSPANATTGSNARAPVPKISSRAGGQTLGGNAQTNNQSTTPREAAARAAEERSKNVQGKGKLGRQLQDQRGQTVSQALQQNARDNAAARDADAAREARNWN